MTKALLKNYRQSARKVRLVVDSVKGKKVQDALNQLQFMPKRAAGPVKKVIESALANAKDNSIDTDNLIIKKITVDEGVTLKRWMPKWRGTAHPIRKRTSHITVILGTTEKALKPKSEITKKTESKNSKPKKEVSDLKNSKKSTKPKTAKKIKKQDKTLSKS